MKKVLLTGGAGFIGANLARRGWQPTTPLADGLAQTWEWFEGRVDVG